MNSLLVSLTDCFQIALIAIAVYYILHFLRGTRAAQMLIGVVTVFTILFAITVMLDLDVLTQILKSLSLFMIGVLIVVFHPELRRGLSLLGEKMSFSLGMERRMVESPIDILVMTCRYMAQRRIGALIAIERTVSLDKTCESGVAIDGLMSMEILVSIFTPPLPLHDGGVIIHGNRIRAAQCLFPIDNDLKAEGAGTRHRAALGLSNESDALILVVSEERGWVSAAREGKIHQNIDDHAVERYLRAAFVKKEHQSNFYSHVFGNKGSSSWFARVRKFFNA